MYYTPQPSEICPGKQEWFNIRKINVIYHSNRTRGKNYMIISTGVEKTFDKTKLPFTIKPLRKLGIKRNFLDMVKDIYEKPTFNGERLKASVLRSGRREGCMLSPLLFSIILKVLSRAIRQEK